MSRGEVLNMSGSRKANCFRGDFCIAFLVSPRGRFYDGKHLVVDFVHKMRLIKRHGAMATDAVSAVLCVKNFEIKNPAI